MDRGLGGDDGNNDGPCGELNMIAVSNPCVLDRSLAPEGYMGMLGLNLHVRLESSYSIEVLCRLSMLTLPSSLFYNSSSCIWSRK